MLMRFLLLFLLCVPVRTDAQEVTRLATFEFAPYVRIDNGRPVGFSVDVVREAFARIGEPLRIDAYPVARAIAYYEAGKVDGLFTIKPTEARRARMLFTRHPVLKQDFVLFGLRESDPAYVDDLSALAGMTVGVVTGLTYGERFAQAVRAGVLRADDATTLAQSLRKLLAGRVDLVISSRAVGQQAIRDLGLEARVEVKGAPVESAYSYLALQPGIHEDIARRFDQALDDMQRDGTLRRIERAHGL
ncbi:substrate-binding periplasmic protein [Propionivibrio dicarboxylicus]|uniref:Polar amino acid transport system substrate-binding protein n=1 Tax=Propionivibrio dicarboxylicus TaxID=83767 RepID=A0A1G8BFT3_9RHOO|nr:transporter substrate-binding domain-containing protein [Propionivibrio dicarboxylicus]SDH32106.1 polar amino acid transport system substrate-binding protein [Propionivibrio dicarboxylicus]